MEILLQSLQSEWEMLLRAAPRIIFAVLVFLIVLVIGRLMGRGLSLVLARAEAPKTHREFFRKVVIWVFVFLGLSIAFNIVGLRGAATGLLTGGGVTAVILGFAFREIGENFLAGFFLAFSKPFRHGDLIRSGDLEGVVTKTEIRSTQIRTADGRDIFIPSSQLFKNPLINFTLDGLRRFEFKLGIDYRNDPAAAGKLILDAIRQEQAILKKPAPFAGLSELADATIQITVTFWVNAFEMSEDIRTIRARLMNRCREALINDGYTMSSEVSAVMDLRTIDRLSVAVSEA